MSRVQSFLFVCICGCLIACDGNSEPVRTAPPEIDDAQAILVVEGSPWRFDTYELLEVRTQNGADLSDAEISALGVQAFEEVVLNFETDGRGTETGFDPIPSAFFWELNSAGNVVFLDQNGNEFESPLGRFEVDVQRQQISFTTELRVEDPDSASEIVFYGTAFFRGSF